MIISKYKKIISFSVFFISASALSAPVVNDCPCKNNKTVTVKECPSAKVSSPSWWDWITSNKSSRFHFFQLLELIHNDDGKSVTSDNKKENRQYS